MESRLTPAIHPHAHHNEGVSRQPLKQAVSQIGINLTLRSEDTATWLRRCYTDCNFDIDESFSSAGADPVIGVHRHHASSALWQGKTFVKTKE